MDTVEYQRFTQHLVQWAAGEPGMAGLIAVGSRASVTHDPDEWSDHDDFVVTTAEAVARGFP